MLPSQKKKPGNYLFLKIFARAKRGRVVENEYEKANRRHGRPTRRPAKRGGNVTQNCQKAGFKIVPLYFSSGPLLI